MKESELKKLIKEFVNTWEMQDQASDENEAMSPQEVAAILDQAMGGTHASGRKMHPAFVKKN